MDKSGTGKIALVTGANRGIGKGIAGCLAAEGYSLAISYLSELDEAEELSGTLSSTFGIECAVFQAELSDATTPGLLVVNVLERFGRIDLLVNNAGFTMYDYSIGNDVEKLDRLINVDFRGYYLTATAAIESMIGLKIRGCVINITSSRACRAYPEDAVYGGMKAAVERASESLALRYAPHGIRVNCVAPGATAIRDDERSKSFYASLSKKIPLGRVGTPEDVGNAVVWLASEKASYVTGITVRVDGGLILPGIPEIPLQDPERGWGATEEDFARFREGRKR